MPLHPTGNLQMNKRRRIKSGDIFRFAVESNISGFGQVLLSDIIQFIVVFEPLFDSDTGAHPARTSQTLLAGWTSDALFWHGRWEVVDNVPPIHYRFPEYIVEIEGRTWVTDINGHPIRLATPAEAKELTLSFSSAPIAFERAFKAHHGFLPWDSRYQELCAND